MDFLYGLAAGILKPVIRHLSKKRLPQIEGKLKVEGIIANVEIIRDEWGVPHIYADNMHDLSFTQGYVHAQDRLFQMDLNRRVAQGKLSEVVGKLGLDTDRAVRTLGFERIAQRDFDQANDEVKALVQDYSNGVNAVINQKGQKLPVEFKLLGYKPEPWKPVDTLSFSRMLVWQMSFAWFGELVRAQLIEKVGLDKAMELELHYPEINPSTLDKVGEVNVVADDGRLQAFSGPFLQNIKGSNSWTVSAKRTTTGSPILCNDPHLPMMQPAIWYENHMTAGDFQVTGVTVPGIPLAMIGHNRHIAWGMTLAFNDIQDLYIEKFVSDTEYEFKGEKRKAEVIEEVIRVKGKKDHVEKVLITHHGPVISDIVGEKNKKLSICSMPLKDGEFMNGWFGLNKAANWDEFVESMKHVRAPALNVTYADVNGNIGYWVTGETPIRPSGDSSLPFDGATGADEWNGSVPFEIKKIHTD